MKTRSVQIQGEHHAVTTERAAPKRSRGASW
jgi:hypothetical protein